VLGLKLETIMHPDQITTRSISLNTDIGEGYGSWTIADDGALLSLVTDANLACGFHASDPDIMRKTCNTAERNGVAVGAQVGFHDILGFGRRFIEIAQTTLTNDILYQLGALSAFASLERTPIAFVKAHGALYHAAVKYPQYASAVVNAVRGYDSSLPVMCQPGTNFYRHLKDAGLETIREGYIDRAYTEDGLLVPRGLPGAVITDPKEAAQRAVQLATEGTVTTINGAVIEMSVDSLCIHSDSPGAVEVATAVRQALSAADIHCASLSGAWKHVG